ncbi:DUF721 domain-containing protein [Corallincola platygyrae]|uniref:DUF721 domain-containing protein n=1 Tax=Corallincola platygyrae TaxID=1193278 RepID=A0ABW4XTE8_9GAMM
MRPKRPKTLAHLLDHTTGSMSKLQHGAQQITHISKTVKQLLPDNLAAHVSVANYRDGVLVLLAPSSAWAQRVKFAQTMLVSKLRQQGLSALSTIEVRIQPSSATEASSKPTELPHRKLSNSAADQLEALAEHAPEQLKKQLLKLAKHRS